MHRFVLAALVLGLAPVANATPTWAGIKAATWSPVTTVNHDAVGEIQIKKATVSGIDCWGAEADTSASVDKMLEVAMDIEGTIQWSTAGVTEAEVLGREGANKLHYYQYLDVPGWTMASDRFWFLTGWVEKPGTDVIFRWERLEDGGQFATRYNQVKADNSSAVEPPTNVGGWWFSPANGQTHIKYYICSDTGGAIPSFVQSAATKQTLPDTVGDLVREAKKRGG